MKRVFITILSIVYVALASLAHVYHVYLKGSDEARIIVTDRNKNVSIVTNDEGNVCMRFPVYYDNVSDDIPVDQIEEIKFNKPFFRIYPSEIKLPADACYLTFETVFFGPADIIHEASDDYSIHGPGFSSEYGNSFGADVNENRSGAERIFKIPFTNLADNSCQMVTIYQSDKNIIEDDWDKYHLMIENMYYLHVTPEEQTLEIPIPVDDEMEVESGWLRMERNHKPYTYTFHIDENKGDVRECLFNLSGRAFRTNKELCIRQLKGGIHSVDEQIAALLDFYNSTGGSNWANRKDWFSDLPLHKWQGVNQFSSVEDEQAKYRVNSFVTYQATGDNGLFSNVTGMLPPSFTVLMDDAEWINLSFSGLRGKFPKEVINHPRWNEYGWNFISVSTYNGGIIDYSDGINLRAANTAQWDAVRQEWDDVYDVLAEHDYTLVINAPYAPWVDTAMDNAILDAEYVNVWLGYASKGLGLVTSQMFANYNDGINANIYLEMVEPTLLELIKKYNYPQNIRWFDNFASVGPIGTPAIYDREGNLIWSCPRDYLMSPGYFADEAAKILKGIYGDPEAHKPFVIDQYTSTDYTEDGKVIELQKASEGKGIDIVLMGDGFLDYDMDENGRYEELMTAAMESLFLTEPMMSLRNRFNVYAVKVVSPNDFSAFDGQHTLNGNRDVIKQYVEKIEGIDFAKAHTCVIHNAESIMLSGFTWMFPETGSLSIIESGAVSDILIHEVVGHGIGKLLDEYIESGFENNTLDEQEKQVVKDWLKTSYHELGYGMNISSSPIPEETPWAHMLADDVYSKEVSVVQGAWYYPYDLWRPTENSCMRYDYRTFNAPSREAIYKWVMSKSEGSGWTYDFETFKEFDKNNLSTDADAAKIIKAGEISDDSRQKLFVKGRDKVQSPSPVIIHRGGTMVRY